MTLLIIMKTCLFSMNNFFIYSLFCTCYLPFTEEIAKNYPPPPPTHPYEVIFHKDFYMNVDFRSKHLK